MVIFLVEPNRYYYYYYVTTAYIPTADGQGRKTKSFNERADLLSRYKSLPIRFNNSNIILFYCNLCEREVPKKQNTIRV